MLNVKQFMVYEQHHILLLEQTYLNEYKNYMRYKEKLIKSFKKEMFLLV